MNALLNESEVDGLSHEDTLALSFLDVLSCGLGAATLLFILFSVLPHIGLQGTVDVQESRSMGSDSWVTRAGAKLSLDPRLVHATTLDIVVEISGVTEAQVPRTSVSWRGFPNGTSARPARRFVRSTGLVLGSPPPDPNGKFVGSLTLHRLPASISVDQIIIIVKGAGGAVIGRHTHLDVNLRAGISIPLVAWDLTKDPAEHIEFPSLGD